MKKVRGIAVLGVVALLGLMAVSTAASASPREIYADYADNGRLDQTYSAGDLRKALADTTIQGYGKPTVKTGLRTAIQQQLGVVGKSSSSGGTLPFTGVDLALLTAGAGLLLLFGLGFRRLGRARS
jgi:hypothetical protein